MAAASPEGSNNIPVIVKQERRHLHHKEKTSIHLNKKKENSNEVRRNIGGGKVQEEKRPGAKQGRSWLPAASMGHTSQWYTFIFIKARMKSYHGFDRLKGF